MHKACFSRFGGIFRQLSTLKLKYKAYLLCNANHFRANQIMQKPGEILEQIQRIANDMQNKVSDAIRNSPAQEIEKNVRAMMNQGFQKMDLVTREEFEVQSKVLAKTREKLEALEAKVAALEKSTT
jgi:BMFP domain-containing protein YqiC